MADLTGGIRLSEQKIRLKPQARVINIRPYRYSPDIRKGIVQETNEMLRSHIIEPSRSQYNNPICAVRKPDGSLRLTLDLRKLNETCEDEQFLVPTLETIIDEISENKDEV